MYSCLLGLVLDVLSDPAYVADEPMIANKQWSTPQRTLTRITKPATPIGRTKAVDAARPTHGSMPDVRTLDEHTPILPHLGHRTMHIPNNSHRAGQVLSQIRMCSARQVEEDRSRQTEDHRLRTMSRESRCLYGPFRLLRLCSLLLQLDTGSVRMRRRAGRAEDWTDTRW